MRYAKARTVSGVILLTLGCAAGCSKSNVELSAATEQPGEAATAASAGQHDHGGWWCDEHGVPENICGRCDSKLAAEFQRKGDWCQEHDRPDSQCFPCHPQLEATFAAKYEAKTGTKPPKPQG